MSDDATSIVDIDYLLEENKVCFVTKNGNVSTIGPFYDNNQPLEPVLEVPLSHPIEGASWSPDQELIILVRKDKTFLVLNRFWDEVAVRELNPNDFGAGSHVNVGWGSKSTQFHGSEGKAARDASKVVSPSIFEWDDRSTTITWRRDGQMFAISSVEDDGRIIRIWNRDVELQYTSELKDGIEKMLCWRPSGEIIATSQQHFNRHEISFIEPNGQPFGSFTLPVPYGQFMLHQTIWSSDSSILCVWGSFKNSSRQKLMLWTRNNYRWYLKRELVYDGEMEKLSRVMFDPVSGKELHLIFSTGSYVCLKLEWKICSSSFNDTVAVVDGSRVLVTCMSERIIPPPAYFYHVQFAHGINDLSFDLSGNLQVMTSFDSCVYSLSTKRRHENDVELTNENDSEGVSFKLSEVCSNSSNVMNDSILRFYVKTTLQVPHNEPVTLLQSFHGSFMTVQSTISGSSRISLWKNSYSNKNACLHVSDSVLSACEVRTAYSGDPLVALEMNDGSVYILDVRPLLEEEGGDEKAILLAEKEEAKQKLKFMTKFKEACLDFCVIETIEKDERMAIGLSHSSFSLHLNQWTILKNCVTSFLVYDSSHLIVTCSDATLQMWPLDHVTSKIGSSQVMDSSKSQVIQLGHGVEKRCIERGSRIVGGIPSKGSLVLQALRGNLEVIHPRCLMWITVSKMINQSPPNFVPAFELMRKNRMNLNLIHDQNADLFHSNIEKFADQISERNIDFLVLFLTELSEQVEPIPGVRDVPPSNQSSADRAGKVSDMDGSLQNVQCGKVGKICRRMRQIMMGKGNENVTNFLHPILVTYFKCNEITEALIFIKSLQSDTSAAAVSFLKYMIDDNALFNEALATYDMDIVLMVAQQQSNKDPKEYLKLVNDFNHITPFHYRAFHIDTFLKRYEKSIENIAKCDGDKFFEESLQVIDCHRLYKKAIKIYASAEEDKVSQIWFKFGEYLFSKKYYGEAGHAFSRSKNYLKAVKCYQLSGDWNAAVRECIKLNDSTQAKLLYISLIDQLKSSGKFVEAASIAEKYQGNIESSFRILVDGYEWDYVSRLIVSVSNEEKLYESFRTQFWNKLQVHGQSLIERIENNSRKLNEYYLRLVEVRNEKTKQVDDDNYLEDTMSEMGSEFSSSIRNGSTSQSSRNSGSLRTRMTGSGKGAKKMKTKTLKIKEGSSYEDIALLNEYKEIVLLLNSLQNEVGLVLKHLICEFDPHNHVTGSFESIACHLTSCFDRALSLISDHIDWIWTPDVIENIAKRLPSLSLSSETGKTAIDN